MCGWRGACWRSQLVKSPDGTCWTRRGGGASASAAGQQSSGAISRNGRAGAIQKGRPRVPASAPRRAFFFFFFFFFFFSVGLGLPRLSAVAAAPAPWFSLVCQVWVLCRILVLF